MGGSKGGKHSKGKGKSKLMKNETSHPTPKAINSNHDLTQISNEIAEGLGDSKVKSPNLRTKASSLYTVNELRQWGSVPSISRPSGVLSEDGTTDGIKDKRDLSSSSEETQSELTIESSSKKVRILDRIRSTPALATQIRQDLPIVRAAVQREIGTEFIEQQDLQRAGWAPTEGLNLLDSDILTCIEQECVKRWQESSPNDLKTAFIFDLMKSIRDLDKEVKVQKKWAQMKVVASAKRLSKDLLDLNVLKLEKVETRRLKDEQICAETTCKLMLKKAERSLRNVNCEASALTESVRILELSNAHIRADTAALGLSASEHGNELNRLLNREMKCMKTLATTRKQTCNLRANCDEEKQKVLQLQLHVSQAEKEAKEAEDKWKQEMKEKEQALALLAEETRKVGTFKSNLKAELLQIRQRIQIEKNLKKDEVKWLESELSRLRMFHEMSNVSLEGDTFLFNGVEVKSLEQSAPHEPLKHWNCMICFTNEVSVVFLPCTHQVLCSHCYEGLCNSSVSRQCCPYCGLEIQESIKAYAPT